MNAHPKQRKTTTSSTQIQKRYLFALVALILFAAGFLIAFACAYLAVQKTSLLINQ